MSRKETITQQTILDAAFLMTSEEGFSNVTARRLAVKAGCSTQPIFRIYKNMEELHVDLYEKMIQYFESFYQAFPKSESTPFVNLGLTYITFAQKEKNLFQALFLSDNRGGKSLYELLNGTTGAVSTEIAKAKEQGCKDPGELFMKMWIFIHGAACMVITGDYDLSRDETIRLLQDSYQAYAGM
ncbi:MAG: TetR/AcrR family transcriptional regulator [Lachnospiraceae bacterium]